MDCFHNFDGRITRSWNFVRSDAPYLRGMSARFRIADRTLAWKLVTFLTVFAATLPISLAGNHGAARAFATEVSRRQAQVNQPQAVFHTFRLMFDPPSVQIDGFGRNSAFLPRRARIPRANRLCYLLESCGEFRNEIAPFKSIAQNDVQQTHV